MNQLLSVVVASKNRLLTAVVSNRPIGRVVKSDKRGVDLSEGVVVLLLVALFVLSELSSLDVVMEIGTVVKSLSEIV